MLLNYTEHLLILAVTGCVWISAFASFVGIAVGTVSSLSTIKMCIITAGIKRHKWIIKKKKKKHHKVVLLAKHR